MGIIRQADLAMYRANDRIQNFGGPVGSTQSPVVKEKSRSGEIERLKAGVKGGYLRLAAHGD